MITTTILLIAFILLLLGAALALVGAFTAPVLIIVGALICAPDIITIAIVMAMIRHGKKKRKEEI